MATTVTIDLTESLAARGWKLIRSAQGDETLSLTAKAYDMEAVNHDSGTNPPPDSVKGGHDVLMGTSPLPLRVKVGDHIWARIAPNTEDDPFAGIVLTVAT